MPTQVQWRRGTTTQHNSFTGAAGEVTVDTTLDTLRVHDGSTAGGIRIAKFSEIEAGDITAVVAGTGLSGGATSGSATLNLSHLGLESLSDPNDDQIVFWDDSAGATAFLDIGSGLAISGTTLSSSITQYANSDARGAISVTDSGGDGSLAYNSSTGVITYTGPSAAEVRAHISAGTGISISSGAISSTITQYTDTDAQGAITVTDSGGDGSLAYSGGTITYTGPSATEVRAHLSAGTGVSYSGGEFSIGQAVATGSNVTFADVAATGNVTITGNLDVNGTTTTLDTTNSTITDRLIELGNGTTGTPANDMGLVFERGSSDNVFVGWDESADAFVVGTGSFTGASTGDLTYTVANITGGVGTFASLDVSGDADIDGTMEADAYTVNGVSLAEVIEDTVGGMVTGNTETGITVTYDDTDGTIDFVVGTLNQNTTGSAATLTTARSIGLGGDLSGNTNFDGSADITITATIANGAVENAMIADDAVTQDKIADDAVGADQIANNSVNLGTQTIGNYMVQVAGGDGITVSHTQGEGSTATITGTAIYNSSGTKLN